MRNSYKPCKSNLCGIRYDRNYTVESCAEAYLKIMAANSTRQWDIK